VWAPVDGAAESNLRLKKSHSTPPSRHRSRPATTRAVVGADGPDRGGTIDFPGRKRCHDGNDTALRPGVGKRARARRHTGRPLENAHRSGCGGPGGLGRHDDHRSVHDGDVFRAYLEHVLCPQLKAGQIVVMDNLSAHKVSGVRALIEAAGQNCATCRPTRPISIRLRSAGRRSSKRSERPRREHSEHWNKPWRMPWPQLPPKTPPTVSAIADMDYVNSKNGLVMHEPCASASPL